MPLSKLVSLQQELGSQYSSIGFPSVTELSKSDNVVYVHAYTRDDGTKVCAHWRSKPYTGTIIGGASNIFDKKMDNNNSIIFQEPIKKEDTIQINSDTNDYYKKLLVNQVELPKYLEYEKMDKAFIKPVEGKITSDFGPRPVPTKGASRFHKGIDIGVSIGTPVRAIQDGIVKEAGETNMGGYGVGIFIEHSLDGNQIQSEYGHLSKLSVKSGDNVSKGQIIGYSGNSGVSNGPHLHLTIKEYNKNKEEWEYVNPRKYVKY